ncbi:hypothetical protein [Achromobacter ruhlandii]|uniref:hypothetical protein n=1 Tax=Achromobacter ruhlandii TaxID=72557 RepID=UPI001EEF1A53|nr:hypothetical protein [Achromobacter ruhlandii]MCZ8397178.1 hypothetical protein [Achromobacter ruhlandii]
MQSQSSGSINYWPGFVDAFSNLVLALVFVIVILAMSLGMFSGLMAKMAIQRALVEQRLDESRAASAALTGNGTGGAAGGKGPAALSDARPAASDSGDRAQAADVEEAEVAADASDDAAGGNAPASPPARPASEQVGNGAPPEQAAGPGGDAAGMPRAVQAEPSASAVIPAVSGGREGAARDDVAPKQEEQASAAAGRQEDATLRRENDALRQELAALRKKQAALEHGAVGAAAGRGETAAGNPKLVDKFGPTMPQEDRRFRQRIEDELQRTLKEFEARRDSGASIDVVIYVPNYALTENKRTALFYLISIKDYLMKRKVAPGQIRMHMAPAPAGQKDMTVSMSVEP